MAGQSHQRGAQLPIREQSKTSTGQGIQEMAFKKVRIRVQLAEAGIPVSVEAEQDLQIHWRE